MSTRLKDDRASQLTFAEKLLTNAQKVPEIKTAMSEYGYTPAKYTRARELFTLVKGDLADHSLDWGGQKVATAEEGTAKKDAVFVYRVRRL